MHKKPHLLITGIRRPGNSRYRFRIYGYPGSQFPPIDLESTLGGLGHWLAQGETLRDELRLRRAGVAVLPIPG